MQSPLSFGPFKINFSHGVCKPDDWAKAVDAAAIAAGVNLNFYQHRIYILPNFNQLPCNWVALADFGCSTYCRIWNAHAEYSDVNIHELAHNISMNHAGTDPEDDGISNTEYGDYSDPMGNKYFYNKGFNGAHVATQNWTSHYPQAVQTVTENGTFDLYPLSYDPASIGKTQILKMAKPNSLSNYYISYRRPVNFDNSLESTYTTGISIHSMISKNSTYQTLLVKVLTDGQSFSSPTRELRITQMPRNGDLSHATVKVEFLCERENPALTVTPPLASLKRGQSISYTLKVKNNDLGACRKTTFKLNTVLPPELGGVFDKDALILAKGEEAQVSLAITGNGEGSFTFPISVKDESGNHSKEVAVNTHLFVNKSGSVLLKSGIGYQAYKGIWSSIPDFSKLRTVARGRLLKFSPGPYAGTDSFGLSFDSFLYIPTNGNYTFFTNSDEGSKLYLDEKLVVSNDGVHRPTERSGSLTLSSGWHSIKVDYFDRYDAETLAVSYQGPGIKKQEIPTEALVTLDNTVIPPTVNAGPDQVLTFPNNRVLLTVTATDPDGTIVSLKGETESLHQIHLEKVNEVKLQKLRNDQWSITYDVLNLPLGPSQAQVCGH